jgi:hypothetical protein
MMLLTGVGSSSFIFALFLLFWWRPDTPLEVRIALAGIYLLIATVAAAAVAVLMRLDMRG